MSTASFSINDPVTYADINLFVSGYRGTIVALGPGRNGADCRVQWTSPALYVSDECLFNLRHLKQGE